MKNRFIGNLNEKDVNGFTSDTGLFLRRALDKPFKYLCGIFTGANIIRPGHFPEMTDEEYWESLDPHPVPLSCYPIKKGKNNIVLERYPHLVPQESYIFVGNHSCPEDIETMLNIIDRNAYLILGSLESLKYNPEMYLTWLNGMIVFDILDPAARKGLMAKMERVLKTNSILIFPEGSHNYHPNKLINHLFDGPVNLALRTGKKIVPVILVRDGPHQVSYIDVGNPVDLSSLRLNVHDYYPGEEECEKYRVKALNAYLRDKMATAVYHLIARHIEPVSRGGFENITEYFVSRYVEDSFSKLHWQHDVFDAEFLVKKTKDDLAYEETVHALSNLRLNRKVLAETSLHHREYVLKERDLAEKDVVSSMRKRFDREKKHKIT